MHGGRPDSERTDGFDRLTAIAIEWAKWAVACWSDFPVDEKPRPMVLVQPRVRVEHGFTTGTAKLAFVEGLVESLVELPKGLLDVIRQHDGRARSAGREPLIVTSAALEVADFMTDRGAERLPAWRLSARDALGPIWILDPGVTSWEPAAEVSPKPPAANGPAQQARTPVEVGQDDRSLVVEWLGSTPNYERYQTAAVIESSRAVAVVPIREDIGPPGPRTAAGHVHRVLAVLQKPLHDRVLVDLRGRPQQAVRLTEA